MILDTENIKTVWHFNQPASTAITVSSTPAPSPLEYRVAELEAAVAAQARELSELRSALKGVTAALQRLDGDGK